MAGFGGHGRGPRLIGFLCQWDPHKACGFLDCEGNRLFVHKSEFAQQFRDGEEPPLGTRLSFVVGADPRSGKDRACDIWIEQPMPYGGPPSLYGGPPGKGGPPGSAQRAPQGRPPGGAAMGAGGRGRGPRLHGVLREWDRRKACGFLDCDGKRLFVHKTEFLHPFPDGAEPQPGTELTFVHGVDSKSGKERACEIQVESVIGPYGRGFGGPGFGGGPGPGYGGPGRGFGGGMPPHGCMPFGGPMPGAGYGPYGGYPGYGARPPQQQRLFGKLCDWNPDKACGFVECTDPPGKRLFVHKTEFAVPFPDGYEPPMGTPFSFFLGSDPKSGKQRAVDIRIQDAQHGASGGGFGPLGARRRLAGTLEEWSPEKGCGFIHARDTPGKKFFAHKTEFAVPFVDGEEPALGVEVHFVIGHDPRSGKERAQDIQLGPLDESAELPRLYGTLKEWNSQKACGFIECERPGKSTPGKLFAHKSEFAEPFEDGEEPALGTELSFLLGHDSKSGKERAVDIRLAAPDEAPPSKRPRFGA